MARLANSLVFTERCGNDRDTQLGTKRKRVQNEKRRAGRFWGIVMKAFHLITVTAMGAVVVCGNAAFALDCTSKSPPMLVAVAACDYGVPTRSGEFLLIPKVCRLETVDGAVDRHAADVFNARTGTRVGQAGAGTTKTTKDKLLQRVGVILNSNPPLLAWAGGIAKLQPRTAQAESLFESDGELQGVILRDDLLAVADRLPPSRQHAKGAIEWTILDLSAGEIMGQATLAGQKTWALQFRAEKARAVTGVIVVESEGKRYETTALLRNDAGKAAAKDGAIKPVTTPAATAAAPLVAKDCGVLHANDAALLLQPSLVVSSAPDRAVAAKSDLGVKFTDAARCLATVELDAQGNGFAWFDSGGVRDLRSVQCK